MDELNIVIITNESTISILITYGVKWSNTSIIHICSSVRIDNIT